MTALGIVLAVIAAYLAFAVGVGKLLARRNREQFGGDA